MTNLDDYQMPEGSGTTIGKCLTFAEIEGLLAAERERCAAVADELAEISSRTAKSFPGGGLVHYGGRTAGARIIAEAIRNLPPRTEGT